MHCDEVDLFTNSLISNRHNHVITYLKDSSRRHMVSRVVFGINAFLIESLLGNSGSGSRLRGKSNRLTDPVMPNSRSPIINFRSEKNLKCSPPTMQSATSLMGHLLLGSSRNFEMTREKGWQLPLGSSGSKLVRGILSPKHPLVSSLIYLISSSDQNVYISLYMCP